MSLSEYPWWSIRWKNKNRLLRIIPSPHHHHQHPRCVRPKMREEPFSLCKDSWKEIKSVAPVPVRDSSPTSTTVRANVTLKETEPQDAANQFMQLEELTTDQCLELFRRAIGCSIVEEGMRCLTPFQEPMSDAV